MAHVTRGKGSEMRTYLAAAVLVALVLPVVATAKGPVGASISGPGLDRPLAVSGDGEGPGTALGTLATASGFFPQMFGQSPDPTLRTRPVRSLGPRYKVVYTVPGPGGVDYHIVQLLYPYAKRGALSYMRAGQMFWNTEGTHGGWFRASASLKRMLLRAGLPAKQSS
jgi:hypothetical protein